VILGWNPNTDLVDEKEKEGKERMERGKRRGRRR